jgi:hypothetical protein
LSEKIFVFGLEALRKLQDKAETAFKEAHPEDELALSFTSHYSVNKDECSCKCGWQETDLYVKAKDKAEAIQKARNGEAVCSRCILDDTEEVSKDDIT